MKLFYVGFGNSIENYDQAIDHVQQAFMDEELVPVDGNFVDAVPIHYDLEVYNVHQQRVGVKKILEFTGVTRPDGEPYSAIYSEVNDAPPIELRVYTQPEYKPND
ncbi:MAG TPA: hypothetical protein VG992_04555 [Candidatus Saccharimonadales bacterium]|nr:hypothetical protein [Candidatus Saccharimonadales bacterium]